jgi:hypothetical protein
MADLQAEVQAAAGELVAAGTETGLQVAVLRHGRVLADVVSGVADPQTFGFLLGETLRRVTGRTMSELLREVLTGPLGIADEVCFAVPRPGRTLPCSATSTASSSSPASGEQPWLRSPSPGRTR